MIFTALFDEAHHEQERGRILIRLLSDWSCARAREQTGRWRARLGHRKPLRPALHGASAQPCLDGDPPWARGTIGVAGRVGMRQDHLAADHDGYWSIRTGRASVQLRRGYCWSATSARIRSFSGLDRRPCSAELPQQDSPAAMALAFIKMNHEGCPAVTRPTSWSGARTSAGSRIALCGSFSRTCLIHPRRGNLCADIQQGR